MKKTANDTPVYMVIYENLRDKIVNEELMPGAILPSESELCASYQASRETVRKGLKELEQEGLIYSRPRRGYFVCDPQHDQFTLSFASDFENSDNRVKDIKILQPSEEIREALGLSPTDKVIAVSRGNYDGEKLMGIEVKYLPYHRGLPLLETEIDFAVFPEAVNAKTASFRYYTQVEVTAVAGPEDIRGLMECEDREPFLLIKKIYISQSGERIGYSRHYLRSPYGALVGSSGYMQKR